MIKIEFSEAEVNALETIRSLPSPFGRGAGGEGFRFGTSRWEQPNKVGCAHPTGLFGGSSFVARFTHPAWVDAPRAGDRVRGTHPALATELIIGYACLLHLSSRHTHVGNSSTP